MPKKLRTIERDGEFWFSVNYSAELLGIARRKAEMLAVREIVRSYEEKDALWLAEVDVRRLRMDEAALRKAQEAVRVARIARPSTDGELTRSTRRDLNQAPLPMDIGRAGKGWAGSRPKG